MTDRVGTESPPWNSMLRFIREARELQCQPMIVHLYENTITIVISDPEGHWEVNFCGDGCITAEHLPNSDLPLVQGDDALVRPLALVRRLMPSDD